MHPSKTDWKSVPLTLLNYAASFFLLECALFSSKSLLTTPRCSLKTQPASNIQKCCDISAGCTLINHYFIDSFVQLKIAFLGICKLKQIFAHKSKLNIIFFIIIHCITWSILGTQRCAYRVLYGIYLLPLGYHLCFISTAHKWHSHNRVYGFQICGC